MERYHPLLELAPRDVVARAITREGMGEQSNTRQVFLDMRHVRGIDLHKRFPGISAFLARYSLDLHRDLIPVRPAAHYLMGGIRTDLMGRSNVRGLYAAGEVACTGVHGANRLASNSLLEGLVFGARAAKAMLDDDLPVNEVKDALTEADPLRTGDVEGLNEAVAELKGGMWADGGLLRSGDLLHAGLRLQAGMEGRITKYREKSMHSRPTLEAASLSSVARSILCSALARKESRGAHFRSDYPQHEDAEFRKHSIYTADGLVRFESW